MDETTVAYLGHFDSGPVSDGFPDSDDLTGTDFAIYRLGDVIGCGSMSRVYRARHATLERPCALKVLNPGLVERSPQMLEQFWAEARVVANLVHPNIVTVHNLGRDRGYHFIEMEYVEGRSLRDHLIKDGPIDPLRASTILHQVVDALGKAHESGLVHRDVKPTNVLLTDHGQAKLADFGLVRHLRELEVGGVSVGGTPTFMAPELFAGVAASPRSDLYAVGVMFYYLLSARLPYASDTVSRLVRMHFEHPVPDIRKVAETVPEPIQKILERCLAKRVSERYESADELAEDLLVVINSLRDADSLLHEALEGLDCFLQGGNERYRVFFRLPNNRVQEVYFDVSRGRRDERVLSVFSVCGPADPRHFEYVLRLNSQLTYGGLSIRVVNGQPMFVMTRSYDPAHVSPNEIRAAMLEIAKRSDWLEQQISPGDVF
ncbi:MAG: serine/threonine-protein kinase [Isosphaeraceae bacterium]|nr:serine/threonine-protein kinase [Isosphaeraceae bacterium]